MQTTTVYHFSLLFFSQSSSKQIKLAALILRRTPKKEKPIYQQIIPYQATDYEVLLRYWPSEPYFHSLAAFSGPVYSSPEVVLVEKCRDWSEKLAETAGHPDRTGIKGMINGWMDWSMDAWIDKWTDGLLYNLQDWRQSF